MSGADFSLTFDVKSSCVRCKADRAFHGLKGTKILSGDLESGTAMVFRAETACACGENRIKVECSIE
jgi:hypothetical protein